jgi:PilZ domain
MTEADGGLQQEERRDQRYEGRLEAVLRVDGAWWRCWIRDLSLGGAGLDPALPALLGREVELRSPGFGFDGGLRGRVINVADQRTCLAFDLEPAAQQGLGAFLAANVGRPMSAPTDPPAGRAAG